MGRENRTGAYELPQNPTLADVITVAIRNHRLSMRTHTMCTVTAYNAATQRVAVSVDILQRVNDNTREPSSVDPDPTAVLPPVQLADIPVHFPRTTSGYITFPILPGDKGELHVQDRDIDAYLSKGLPADPIAMWTHSLSGSVFYPSLIHDKAPITPPTDLGATVVEGDAVKVGRLATLPAARQTDAVAAGPSMTAWIAAVNAAFAALAPPVLLPTPTDFGAISGGSTKVTVE
jgi:hypothetical protein